MTRAQHSLTSVGPGNEGWRGAFTRQTNLEATMSDPTRKPDHRQNNDIERSDEPDPRVPEREGDVAGIVEPEDEDRRVRPGEKRPEGIMP